MFVTKVHCREYCTVERTGAWRLARGTGLLHESACGQIVLTVNAIDYVQYRPVACRSNELLQQYTY